MDNPLCDENSRDLRAVSQFHARAQGLDCFTVLSTVSESFAAKLRNSAKRHENEVGYCHL
jgi:hypothetical protein